MRLTKVCRQDGKLEVKPWRCRVLSQATDVVFTADFLAPMSIETRWTWLAILQSIRNPTTDYHTRVGRNGQFQLTTTIDSCPSFRSHSHPVATPRLLPGLFAPAA